MEMSFTFPNLKEFTDALKAVPKRMQREGLKPAVRRSGRAILNRQKRKLKAHIAASPPRGEKENPSRGLLEAALKSVTVRENPAEKTRVVALVGIVKKSLPQLQSAEKDASGRPKGRVPFYWIFLEHGWDHDGKSEPPRPFIRTSVMESKSEVEHIFQEECNKAVAAINKGPSRNIDIRTSTGASPYASRRSAP